MSSTVPLTVQQEWLWDVIRTNQGWQCAPARAFRLSGVWDISLLEQCLQEVIGRHDALRTRIVESDGVVSQEIQEPQELVLKRVTVGGATSAEVVKNARRLVEDVCDRKVNLSVDPLWSTLLLELSDDEHWLVLSMHRLIGDCASIDQTYQETKLLYGEWSRGQPSPLKVPAQYGDYALWQQRTSAGWVKHHQPYWRRYLSGAPPLRWPADVDLTITAPGLLGKARCSFGKNLSANLLKFARHIRTLPAVPMLAIYAAVLRRWCQQGDFVLPFNTAGRPTEYKSAIGYFSYALCLHIHINPDETFKDFSRRIGSEFFSSLLHQDFGRIARQQPELLSGTVFQWVTWYVDDVPDDRVDVRDFGEGLTIVPPGMTAIEVSVFDSPTGLHAFGSYRADRFTAETIGRFMEDLQWIAELFVNNPDARMGAYAEARGDVHGMAGRPDRDGQCATSSSEAEPERGHFR